MRRRARLAFGAFLICVAVVALGSAGIANSAVNSNPPDEECNTDGRIFCIDVNTFSNITASDPTRADDGKRYTYVEWQMRNETGTTLTHPTVTATLTDYCGSAVCTTQTSAFVPSGGQSATVTYPNIAAGGNTGAFTRFYFKTADLPATHTVIAVTGTVKERQNDANLCAIDDPNCDTLTTSVTNSYEPEQFNGYTFAIAGSSFHLASNDERYSFDFTSTSPSVFFAQFQALAESTNFCFGSVPCFDRTLFADTGGVGGFSATNPVVFYARLLDPPGGVTPKNLAAIHIYDAIDFQVSSNRLTPVNGTSFARMDGVQIGTTKYFVVGYQATSNSFQISLTEGGTPVSIADGTVSGKPIRIIGDQSDERSNENCPPTLSDPIPLPVPSICAKKVSGLPQAIDAWVTDGANGEWTFG